MKFDPKDIVEHLRYNLRERYPYDDGLTVFRELLQNADDAKATKVCLRLLDGWLQASNPLLQGSGLLLVNDGAFDEHSAEGMQTFGGSIKATDQEAVGRFGLGQKSVFHICDAFIVIPHGYEASPEPFVVNPFLALRSEGDDCILWNEISRQDAARIIAAGEREIPESQRLHLWFPLRRPSLRPKPTSRGIVESDISPDMLRPLADGSRLAKLLACLRHVREIDVSVGTARVRVSRGNAPRMIGYAMKAGENTFGGDLGNGLSYVGRERMAQDDFCLDLRKSESWPRVRNRQTDEEEPQKAVPHGAVILVAGPNDKPEISGEWAVMLPVVQAFAERLDDEKVPQLQVLLHGCFFVDSGRRDIIDLDEDRGSEEVSTRARWNQAIRDRLILPLLPAVLHDALDRKVLTGRQLAAAVRALAGSDFGQRHRKAIAHRHLLAQVVEASKKGSSIIAAWRLLPADVELRPLPAADSQGRIACASLHPDLLGWAARRNLTLVCEPDEVLAGTRPRWQPEELASLISQMDPSTFASAQRTRTLAEMLRIAVHNDADLRKAVAEPVVSLLRQTLASESKLASHEEIGNVLSYLDCSSLVRLPGKEVARAVLRTLARVGGAPLCVPEKWLGDESDNPASISPEDAVRLIKALQPLLKDRQRTGASAVAAAVAILRNVGSMGEVLAHPELKSLPTVRVMDGRGTRLTSIAELQQASKERRLFGDVPKARKLLPLLVQAVPDCGAFVLSNEAANVLGNVEWLEIADLSSDAAASLMRNAGKFGPESARAELLSNIIDASAHYTDALRALAVGDCRAGDKSAQLFALSTTTQKLEQLVRRSIADAQDAFLVPASIMDRLERKKVGQLGIKDLAGEELGELLVQHAEELAAEMDEMLAGEILDADLPEHHLKRLPVIRTNHGGWACPAKVWKVGKWPVSQKLYVQVPQLGVADTLAGSGKAEKLVETWSPRAQITVCLEQDSPADFAIEILDALEKLERVDDNQQKQLREARWLLDRQGQAWAPEDVLDLPDDVLDAASSVLEDEAPFVPVTDIAPQLREHVGFEALRKYGILPDEEGSVERLLLMVEEIKPSAWLGERSEQLHEALHSLARAGKHFPAPGWPLLAALLKRQDDPERLFKAFGEIEVGKVKDAIRWLDALADAAAAEKKLTSAAYEAYACGFRRLGQWKPEDARAVLSKIRVRTRDGNWRPAGEVAVWVDGIAAAHRLDEKLESIWPRPDIRQPEILHNKDALPGETARSVDASTSGELEEKCANSLKPVLDHVAAELSGEAAALLAGIVRRTENFRKLVRQTGLATGSIDRIWEQLKDIEEKCHTPAAPGRTLSRIRHQTFLQFSLEQPKTVKMKTLTGERRSLPTELEPLSIIANDHLRRHRISFEGNQYWLHRVRIAGVEQPLEKRHVQQLLRKLAAECLDFQDACLDELDGLLDECLKAEQATVEDARIRLEDRLPSILSQLKPEHGTALRNILDEYERKEQALPVEQRSKKLPAYKKELWERLKEKRVVAQLLALVRKTIESYGYDPSRVIFELFQNADDACHQHEPPFMPEYRIELTDKGARVLHWGRLINHLGADPERGERQNWQSDLFNMLLMNLSEKREEATGRFGLGFKSVHLVAQEVRIASGVVSCRIVGGMLPEVWDEGCKLSFESAQEGRRATIIELDRDAERPEDMLRALEAFERCVRWLPAMARSVRHITIDGKLHSAHYEDLGTKGIRHVRFDGVEPGHALALSLDENTTLFLPLGPDGPQPAPPKVPRLWLLAPLEEECTAGWLLNSSAFRVDPGRGRLAGTSEDRAKLFRRFGKALGERLVALHDLVRENWADLAQKTGLANRNPQTGASHFLKKLVDLLKTDLEDPLAKHMHEEGGGLHRLLSERPALFTALPKPFAPFLRLKDIGWEVTGSLADPVRLEKLRGWKVIDTVAQHMVGHEAAHLLGKLTGRALKKFDSVALLRMELGTEKHVDPDAAGRLGALFDEQFLERETSWNKKENLLKEASQALFRMADGTWKKAGLPPRNASEVGEEERRILAFAPDSAVGHLRKLGISVGI